MYCGACTRDFVLARGLISRGHDVSVLPLYTPLRTDSAEPFVAGRVFLGGINAWLQQQSALFRYTPAWLDRIFDSPGLLWLASGLAVKTRPRDLGAMTVSVLAGTEGRQVKEFRKLISHLQAMPPPDLFIITNTLLSGFAQELKRHFAVPLICGVQGEDAFLTAMPEPHRDRARELMQRNSAFIDLFISPTPDYAREMAAYLSVPHDRMRVVRTGIVAEDYALDVPRVREPFTIGYLSVITPAKGLDILVEAWRLLAQKGDRDIRLRVAGRVLDRGHWRGILNAVRRATLAARFEYCGEVDFAGKVDFLRRCSAFSVPGRCIEHRGLATMEALACGVPVVVPDAGVFPEMISRTGGGLLVPPDDARALAEKMMLLMSDPENADRMGREGARGIAAHYHAERSVEDMLGAIEAAMDQRQM